MARAVAGFLMMMLAALAAAPLKAADETKSRTTTKHVFAVAWQPGFCQTRRTRVECTDPNAAWRGRDAFSLHGLWQMRKSYCGIDAERGKALRKAKWTALPPFVLSDETRRRLDVAMPGTVSGLDRHQWLRNGTCHAATAEDYYRRSLDMLDRINASGLPALFAGKTSGNVTIAEVRQAFDTAFGAGAGDRVRLSCRKVDGKPVVTGLTIGLGPVDTETPFGDLILAAGKTESKCNTGRVVLRDGV